MEEKIMPKHIAVIMDGNRRWAKERNLKVSDGHQAGANTLEKIALYCNKIGIKILTVYAFSTENWKRSEEEVKALMKLLKMFLTKFSNSVNKENIKINVLGDIEPFEKDLKKEILKVIKTTENNNGMIVNIALNYGGRREITNAMKKIACKVKSGEVSIDQIDENLISDNLYTAGQQDPDLLIRPGGEIRTSNFLPWQLVYTEFYFLEKYWPDFDEQEIDKAVELFRMRNRKYGGK